MHYGSSPAPSTKFMKEIQLIPVGKEDLERELELTDEIAKTISQNKKLAADSMGVGIVSVKILSTIHNHFKKHGIKMFQDENN